MKDFQPLLAAREAIDIATLRYPVLASPKFDGIRCVKLDGKALTRKLKPIPNDFARTWIERWLPEGIDGELMLRDHRAPFNDVSSAIMSKDGEPDFVFCAFDFLRDPNHTNEPDDSSTWANRATEHEFVARHQRLWLWARANGAVYGQATGRLMVVPHTTAHDEAALREIVTQHLDRGYEGTMVRDPAGRYKFGRSTVKEGILLKIKPRHDEEATVIDVVEQMHNTNEQVRDERGYAKRSSAKSGKVGTGKLGTLVCLTEDGVHFEIGTGFTDAQRTAWWTENLLGRQVKFKHLGRTKDNVPRGPVFLGWRED